jgi:hypothetical protein
MSRFKDFGAGKNEGNKSPLSFKLHGEEFSCVPQVQGKTLLSLVSVANTDDPVKSAEAVNKFFEIVLLDESLERFNKIASSKDKIITVETLADIVAWLMEEYSGRPEEQPEVS